MTKGSGTRSGLLWEVERLLDELKEIDSLPQYLLMENVPQVIGEKNKADFRLWTSKLGQLGYHNFYQILNAKDYGIPQNRARCFMVSTLYDKEYEFPRTTKLNIRLKDLLEENVDESYYLSKKMIDYCTGVNIKSNFPRKQVFERNLKNANEKGIAATITTAAGQRPTDNFILDSVNVIGNYMPSNHEAGRIVDPKGIAPTVKENHGTVNAICDEGMIVPNNTKKGYLIANHGDGVDISGRMESHRGTVQKGLSQTIKTQADVGVCVDDNLKTKLCNKLVDENMVNEGDIVKHSYTSKILNGEKKAVEKQGEMITLTTRPDCIGVCVGTYQYSKSNRFMGNKDRFQEGKNIADTLLAAGPKEGIVNKNLRIRKLTPKECWRLMGFDDEDYENASKVVSKSQLYKQAGNSIVVNVLEAIMKNMFEEVKHESGQVKQERLFI